MKKALFGILVAAGCALAGIAQGGANVLVDFNEYTTQATLGAPWESVSSMWGNPTLGYDGTPGALGPPNSYTRGRAYLDLTGEGVAAGDMLVGQMYLNPDTDTQRNWLHLSSATTDQALRTAGFFFSGGSGTATLTLHSLRLDGDGLTMPSPAVQSLNVAGLSLDTWYDVRMTITNEDMTYFHGEYRASGAEDWIEIGTISGAYASWDDLDDWKNMFSPNYLNMQAMRGGYMDNVGVIPEPASVLLLAGGSLLLGWIRRRR